MSYAILIDVGGTFLKGTTVDLASQQLNSIVRRGGPPLRLSTDGSATLDAIHLRQAVHDLCRELVATTGDSPKAIFVSGQMHGVVLTDQAGNPKSDVVTWRDSLSSRINEREVSPTSIIRERCGAADLMSFGNELREGLPLATLTSRRTRGLHVAGLIPHSLISYCASSLINFSQEPLMHSTDAAAHGFYRVATNSWGDEVLEQLGLAGLVLPRVVKDVEPYGTSQEFNCSVYIAVGDQQASLYSMNLERNEVSLNIATGSQVTKLLDSPNSPAQLRPYFHGKFISTVTHVPAGRALNVLVNLVGELSGLESDKLWEEIAMKTIAERTSTLNVDLAFFPSVSGSSGEVADITETNFTVGKLFRSAVHEMAMQYRRFTTELFPLDDFNAVVISGGLATRFSPLMEEIKAIFGECSYRISTSEDATLQGLARISGQLLR